MEGCLQEKVGSGPGPPPVFVNVQYILKMSFYFDLNFTFHNLNCYKVATIKTEVGVLYVNGHNMEQI